MAEKTEKTEKTEETEEAPKKAKKSNPKAIAKEILAGEGGWGTGRDRDEKLKRAGHDPAEVRAEVYKQRGEAAEAEES